MLVLSPYLARSYHHLFPMPDFIKLEDSPNPKEKEIEKEKIAEKMAAPERLLCAACQATPLNRVSAYQCPSCRNLFCPTCTAYIQTSLHFCPHC
jgi:transcription initiation factor TFIIH subunit 2